MLEFGRSGPHGPLRAGMAEAGTFELLIPMGHDDYPLVDDSGSMVCTGKPLYTKHGLIRFFSIRPIENGYLDAFARIADTIAGRIHEGAATESAVQSAVEEFRRLVAKTKQPDRSLIVGLFGELTFLLEELQSNPEALSSWTGPRGTRHDFTNEGLAIEIKTTVKAHPTVVTIHGLHQLTPVADERLYLLIYGIEEVGKGGKSLKDLIDEIVARGISESVLAGYISAMDLDAAVIPDKPRFVLQSRSGYRIEDSFPRVTAGGSMTDDGSPAIGDVSYSLQVGALTPYRMQESETWGFTNRTGGSHEA